MNDIPKWAWWAGGAVVLVALVLSKKSAGASAPTLTATPTAADPNVEATNQASILARASAFSDLAGGFFGLRATQAGYTRDVNVAALGAGSDVARAGIARDIAGTSEYYQTARTALEQSGLTTRTGIEQNAQTTRTGLETSAATTIALDANAGETSRTRINADTNLSINSIQAGLNKYLADVGLVAIQDTNRSAVSMNASNNAVQRKKSTDNLFGNIFGSLATLGALFF